MTTLTFYEKYDKNLLLEVINCENLPLKNDKEDQEESLKSLLTKLKKMYNKKIKKDSYEVLYKQKKNFGRFYASSGLQNCPKEIRKYISKNKDFDLDMENCHPNLLEQTFVKYGLDCGEFLREYNKNRNDTMKKYNLKDKLELIKVINYENPPNKECFKDLHNKIYNKLINEMLKDNIYKNLFKTKIKTSDENKNGKFISYYLQNEENKILQSMINYLLEKNIEIHTLMFDGLTIDNSYENINDLLKEMEYRILSETKYRINLTIKSTETEWKPIPKKVLETDYTKFDIEFLNEIFNDCNEEEDNKIFFNKKIFKKYVLPYLSNFLCRIQSPSEYGFRHKINRDFEFMKTKPDEINPFIFKEWMNCNDKLEFYKRGFYVNSKSKEYNNKEYLNLYVRPKMTKYDLNISFEKMFPIFYNFLFEIICNNNEKCYNYIINWISKLVVEGSTKQLITLMGIKGIGKSNYAEICGKIIGSEYSISYNNVDSFFSNFNAEREKMILISLEEIVSDAGSYHSINQKLKDLVTANNIVIEGKGKDRRIVPNNNSYIFMTNNLNPINVTDDNRRYFILEVNPKRKGDTKYFTELFNEINENIEQIRYYFFNYSYENNLNNIRPTTDAELDLIDLNKTSIQRFIEDEIKNLLKQDTSLDFIYNEYKNFCSNNGYKKPTNSSYVSKELHKKGFLTKRKNVNGIKKRFFINDTNKDTNNTDDDTNNTDDDSY